LVRQRRLVLDARLENGPAAEAGIREGDALLAAGGRSAHDLSKRDLLRWFTQAPGARVALRTVRDDRPSSVTLVLRELLP
jgi:S1-C subfamily serine protease